MKVSDVLYVQRSSPAYDRYLPSFLRYCSWPQHADLTFGSLGLLHMLTLEIENVSNHAILHDRCNCCCYSTGGFRGCVRS